MKPSEKRSFMFLGIIIIMALSLALLSFGALPLFKNIWALNKALNSQKEEFVAQKQRVEEILAVLNQYRQLPGDQDLINLILPSKSEIPQAINQIIAAAKSSHLIYKGIDFSARGSSVVQPQNNAGQNETQYSSKLNKSYGYVSAKIETIGKYEDIKNWLKSIESNMRVMDVADIAIGIMPGGAEEGLVGMSDTNNPFLSAKTTINVYYQPH